MEGVGCNITYPEVGCDILSCNVIVIWGFFVNPLLNMVVHFVIKEKQFNFFFSMVRYV